MGIEPAIVCPRPLDPVAVYFISLQLVANKYERAALGSGFPEGNLARATRVA